MVSLRAALSLKEKSCLNLEDMTSRKRKRDLEEEKSYINVEGENKLVKAGEDYLDIELHLDAPLPLGWQRCLDIKSGQIHLYNTRTNKRTSKDPKRTLEQTTLLPSLDLDLNLTCEPTNSCLILNNSKGMSRLPSWMFAPEDDRQKMVAAVCMKCHIFVMMCKANLSCPNCKFMHHS
ncbi:uncharacterized protein [Typha angustifolia]|uniref:uncharacterized protein n=1 Tax=Typha angustifolia TaxID=59011 RepID=UPI003C2B0681